MKVYFAGSIRAGRADAGLYGEIIEYIKSKGCTVLTEHVGDPAKSATEQGEDADKLIYAQDTAWLAESDIVIAECTLPSLGVGYELAYAEKLGKPCYILYRKSEHRLSAMLTGDQYFHICRYNSKEDIFALLDEIL